MFAGVGGEVLWKPVDQNWGLGVELNYVWQRDFDSLGFGYYDYDVVTGHASLYWDTGWYGLEASSTPAATSPATGAGRVQLTRRFANGWAVGAYFTLTDVSSEDFGEGSFDKGVFCPIPFRWTDAVRDAADQHHRPDLDLARRRGAARHRRTGSIRLVRDFDRAPAGSELGPFWQ